VHSPDLNDTKWTSTFFCKTRSETDIHLCLLLPHLNCGAGGRFSPALVLLQPLSMAYQKKRQGILDTVPQVPPVHILLVAGWSLCSLRARDE
jgi:hypothetical protein